MSASPLGQDDGPAAAAACGAPPAEVVLRLFGQEALLAAFVGEVNAVALRLDDAARTAHIKAWGEAQLARPGADPLHVWLAAAKQCTVSYVPPPLLDLPRAAWLLGTLAMRLEAQPADGTVVLVNSSGQPTPVVAALQTATLSGPRSTLTPVATALRHVLTSAGHNACDEALRCIGLLGTAHTNNTVGTRPLVPPGSDLPADWCHDSLTESAAEAAPPVPLLQLAGTAARLERMLAIAGVANTTIAGPADVVQALDAAVAALGAQVSLGAMALAAAACGLDCRWALPDTPAEWQRRRGAINPTAPLPLEVSATGALCRFPLASGMHLCDRAGAAQPVEVRFAVGASKCGLRLVAANVLAAATRLRSGLPAEGRLVPTARSLVALRAAVLRQDATPEHTLEATALVGQVGAGAVAASAGPSGPEANLALAGDYLARRAVMKRPRSDDNSNETEATEATEHTGTVSALITVSVPTPAPATWNMGDTVRVAAAMASVGLWRARETAANDAATLLAVCVSAESAPCSLPPLVVNTAPTTRTAPPTATAATPRPVAQKAVPVPASKGSVPPTTHQSPAQRSGPSNPAHGHGQAPPTVPYPTRGGMSGRGGAARGGVLAPPMQPTVGTAPYRGGHAGGPAQRGRGNWRGHGSHGPPSPWGS